MATSVLRPPVVADAVDGVAAVAVGTVAAAAVAAAADADADQPLFCALHGAINAPRRAQNRGWVGLVHLVRGTARFDLVAVHAQDEQDRIQVGHVDGGVGGLLHDRLGVERDTQSGGGQHVEVVGTIADRHGL